jgi:DUF4097 and DUF4098 domain-containing protein YvlB
MQPFLFFKVSRVNNSKIMKSIKPNLLVCAIFLTSLANAQGVTKSFSGIKRVDLSTSSGDVRLEKGNSNEVKVQMTYTYSTSDYRPILEQRGTTLVLKEEFLVKNFINGNSKWIITMPDGLEIKLNSGSGNIEASNLKIVANVNTGSGNYSWKNVSGDSKINTGSGDINVSAYEGQLTLNTGSGDISVDDTNGDIKANAGSGSLSLTGIKGGVQANCGSGNVKAKELQLTKKGSFNSGSGDVLVVLTTPLAYDLSIGSGSGNAVLDSHGLKLEGELVMSANKRNGEIRAPFPFDKTEEIKENGNNSITIRKTVQLGVSPIQIKISTGSGTAEVI